jgi:hypothetical protein
VEHNCPGVRKVISLGEGTDIQGYKEGKLIKLLSEDLREFELKMGKENRYMIVFDTPL